MRIIKTQPETIEGSVAGMVEFARSLSKIDSESDEIKYEPDKSCPREIYLKRRAALKR